MASGTINGSTSNKYITARIVWSSSTNVAANTSSVTAILQYRRTNSGYTTHGTLSRTININGNSASSSGSISIGTSWVEAWRRTVTVSHNGDGTKKCWIGASGGISGTSLSSTSCGATVTLDTIPRASGMSLSKTSVATGENFTVNISPHSNSFSHWIDITGVGSQITYEVAAGVKSCTCTIPKDRVKNFTGSRSATATVYVNTKTGSGHDTKIGVVNQTITVTVPSDVKPTVGTPTFSDTTGAYDAMGAYAAGFSQVSVSVPAKVYSGDFSDAATLKSVTATYNGTTYDAKSGSFSFKPTQSGDMTIVAVDSRGTSSDTYTKSISVKPYEKPSVTVDASRCAEDGIADDTGLYAKVTVTASLDTTNFSGNSATVILQYRERGASAWTSVMQKTITSSQAITAQISASDTKSYELLATITDKITSTQSAMILSNGEVPLDFYKGGRGIAIGKTAEQEGFDIGWPMMGAGFTKSVVDLIYPVGSIYMSVNPTDPTILFGGTWERLKDRFLLAAGDTYAGGTTGGSKEHQHQVRIGWKAYFSAMTDNDADMIGIYNPTDGWKYGASDNGVKASTKRNDGLSTTTTNVTNLSRYSAVNNTYNGPNMPPYLTVYMWKRTGNSVLSEKQVVDGGIDGKDVYINGSGSVNITGGKINLSNVPTLSEDAIVLNKTGIVKTKQWAAVDDPLAYTVTEDGYYFISSRSNANDNNKIDYLQHRIQLKNGSGSATQLTSDYFSTTSATMHGSSISTIVHAKAGDILYVYWWTGKEVSLELTRTICLLWKA